MNRQKETSEYLLEVDNLKVFFPVSSGRLGLKKQQLHAVDGISFRLKAGETLGIVGESGCGKSTAGNAIIRLLEPTEGRILFEGQDITRLSQKEFSKYRKQIQMVFQDPFSSLNPRKKVIDIIAEPFHVQTDLSKAQIREKVYELMELVGLNREYAGRYPHEFSGGQRQRIGIARALALNPKLIICDEPVSALDVSIQAQILNLLKDLQEQLHLTYIFIAHGLPTIQYISDRIAVMYLGKIVEVAEVDALFEHTMHPYTEGLLASIPNLDPERRNVDKKPALEGELPSPIDLIQGCKFCARCKYARPICREQVPELREVEPEHFVCCHFPLAGRP